MTIPAAATALDTANGDPQAKAAIAAGPMPRPHLRGWSHLVAGIAAIALCPLMIFFSAGQRWTAALFSGAVVGLFAISGTYHRVFWATRAGRVFQRLDHAMIFVVIAATYTPIARAALDQPQQAILLAVVWVGASLGAFTKLVWPHSPRWLSVSLYALVGWAILPLVPQVWVGLGAVGFALLVTGGILHTIGALVYALKRPDPWPSWFGFHEVFHLLVIAAVSAHYSLIAFAI